MTFTNFEQAKNKNMLRTIIRFEKHEGGYIILAGGEKVPVSSRKREELLELFEKL